MALTKVDADGLNANVYNVVGPYRNRLINGSMRVAQRATSATVTAGTAVPTASTGYPCVDRWFVYSTGANVTAAQVAGTGATKNRLQITGAASVTAIGVGQRIEQLNSYDLAGGNVTLSVDLANSLLTTVTWTASYATTTADTFGTIGTPTKTQIATGTFTVSSTLTNFTTSFAVPAAATTGIEILFTVGAQTSGTWTIGNVQLEAGLVASSFEVRDHGDLLRACQRYYEKSYDQNVALGTTNAYNGCPCGGTQSGALNAAIVPVSFKVPKRAISTIVVYSPSTGLLNQMIDGAGTASGVSLGLSGQYGFYAYNTGSALAANSIAYLHYTASIEL